MSKLIRHINDLIEEQLDCAENHAEHAALYKDEHPSLAKLLYDMSISEMQHISMMHDEVVKAIDKHRRTTGEPPVEMMAIYNYLHSKQIEKANEVRNYQAHYRGN